jgi:hypothetical protein
MLKNRLLPYVFFSVLVNLLFGTAWGEEGFKFSGDLRLRSELDTERVNDAPDRFRERIRFRFGMKKAINDYLTVTGRLVTGNPDDPNSTHQTMGTSFNSFQFTLDRAYLEYKRGKYWIKGGKFANPFIPIAVISNLVWDDDVQPEGISMGYIRKNEKYNLSLIAGEYIVLEQQNDPEALITAGQLTAGIHSEKINITGGAGGYFYSDPTPAGNKTILDEDNAGNAVDSTGTDFISDFNIIDAMINFTYDASGTPITLSGEFIVNLGADSTLSEEDNGFSGGIRIGKTKEKGDFKVYYQYQEVKQEAVFSAFAQDDFSIHTAFKGHLIGVTWQFIEKANVNLWSMIWKRDIVDDDNHIRIRGDLNLKF